MHVEVGGFAPEAVAEGGGDGRLSDTAGSVEEAMDRIVAFLGTRTGSGGRPGPSLDEVDGLLIWPEDEPLPPWPGAPGPARGPHEALMQDLLRRMAEDPNGRIALVGLSAEEDHAAELLEDEDLAKWVSTYPYGYRITAKGYDRLAGGA